MFSGDQAKKGSVDAAKLRPIWQFQGRSCQEKSYPWEMVVGAEGIQQPAFRKPGGAVPHGAVYYDVTVGTWHKCPVAATDAGPSGSPGAGPSVTPGAGPSASPGAGPSVTPATQEAAAAAGPPVPSNKKKRRTLQPSCPPRRGKRALDTGGIADEADCAMETHAAAAAEVGKAAADMQADEPPAAGSVEGEGEESDEDLAKCMNTHPTKEDPVSSSSGGFRRPPGRAPKGKVWDSVGGAWLLASPAPPAASPCSPAAQVVNVARGEGGSSTGSGSSSSGGGSSSGGSSSGGAAATAVARSSDSSEEPWWSSLNFRTTAAAEEIRQHLARGADMLARTTKHHETILHHVAWCNRLDVLDVIFEHARAAHPPCLHALLLAKDKRGETPFILAFAKHEGSQVARKLSVYTGAVEKALDKERSAQRPGKRPSKQPRHAHASLNEAEEAAACQAVEGKAVADNAAAAAKAAAKQAAAKAAAEKAAADQTAAEQAAAAERVAAKEAERLAVDQAAAVKAAADKAAAEQAAAAERAAAKEAERVAVEQAAAAKAAADKATAELAAADKAASEQQAAAAAKAAADRAAANKARRQAEEATHVSVSENEVEDPGSVVSVEDPGSVVSGPITINEDEGMPAEAPLPPSLNRSPSRTESQAASHDDDASMLPAPCLPSAQDLSKRSAEVIQMLETYRISHHGALHVDLPAAGGDPAPPELIPAAKATSKMEQRLMHLRSVLFLALSRLPHQALTQQCDAYKERLKEERILEGVIKRLPILCSNYEEARRQDEAPLAPLAELLRCAADGCFEILRVSLGAEHCVHKDALAYRIELAQLIDAEPWQQLHQLGVFTYQLTAALHPVLIRVYQDMLPDVDRTRRHAPDARVSLLLLGRQYQSYKDVTQLRTGASGKVVLKATAPDGRAVVLKRFDLASHRRGALRELRMLHKFRECKAVVDVHGYFLQSEQGLGVTSRYCFIQLPYLDHGTLADLHDELVKRVKAGTLDEAGRLAQLCPLWHEVAEALVIMHARDVTHRDVKPSNVLLEMRDGRRRVVIADLEIGHDEERAGLTITNSITTSAKLGTPGYRPPPDISEPKAADVWALGAMVAYEAIRGDDSQPWLGKPGEETERILHAAYSESLMSGADGAHIFMTRVLGILNFTDLPPPVQPFIGVCASLLFRSAGTSMDSVVRQRLLSPPALPPPPPEGADSSAPTHAAARASVVPSDAGKDLQNELDKYREENPYRATRNDGAKLEVPFRMPNGTSGRIAELRKLYNSPRLRRALAALHLPDGYAHQDVEDIFRSEQCRDVIKAACKQSQDRTRAALDGGRDISTKDEYLDEMHLDQGTSAEPSTSFWRAFSPRQRDVLEHLLRALSQEQAYITIRDDFSRRPPEQLLQQGIIEFEGEIGEDAGGLHPEAINVFCTVFSQRFLTDGLIDAGKVNKAADVEAAMIQSKILRRTTVHPRSKTSPEADFAAFGRISLHCRMLGMPTAAGLVSHVYAAAVGHSGIEYEDWGQTRTLAEVKAMHGSKPEGWLDGVVAKLEAILKPHLSDQDALLENLHRADQVEWHFEWEDSALTLDGEKEVVDAENKQWFVLLVLRRKVYGPSTSHPLIRALSEGLRVWGAGVYDALRALSPDFLVEELEGCIELQPNMIADKVNFTNDSDGEQKRMFVAALNACDDSGARKLHLPQLLAWATSYRTLTRELDLRPCKKEPHRNDIVFMVADGLCGYSAHTCFHEVDAPRFPDEHAMLETLLASYTQESLNIR